MTFPALFAYTDTPFNSGTRVQPIDYFVGDGITNTFPLVQKTGLMVGSSTEVDTVLYPRFNGSTIVSGNNVILSAVPTFGQKIVVPGVGGLTFTASDQNDTLGRVYETYFYMADVDTIGFYVYDKQPLDTNIKIQFFHKITLDTSLPSWFQLAPALADGSPGVYLAGGAPLYTAPFIYSDNFQSPEAALSTNITVLDGSQFNAGDYIMLSYGNVNQEVTKIVSILGNNLTITGLQFAHATNDGVIPCGRKFWAKMTIPLNAAGGLPSVFYGTILQRYVRVSARF